MVVQVMKNAADGVMDSRTINRASMDTAIKYTTFFNSQKHMLIGDNSVEDITVMFSNARFSWPSLQCTFLQTSTSQESLFEALILLVYLGD